MSQSQYSFDVSAQTFQSQVIDASHQVPVLVDFWATWCGPCQSLMPVLEKLAEAYQGQFMLAKVEIDQQQELAAHFGVRSVPTVKLVKNGQIVDEFTGAQPEGEIRALLDRHMEGKPDTPMQQAIDRYEQGEKEEALQEMQQIILDDKENMQNRVRFAEILIQEERHDDARQLLDSLSVDIQMSPEVSALYSKLELAETLSDSDDIPTLEKRIETDPKDSEARYQLSARYAAEGRHEDAMQQLLEIVKRDRAYNDDAGRKGLLRMFDLLGNQGELVSKYRRLLAQALN
ncbi:MAG: thioredoxin [Thiohalophilus sp.]|uniref:thioredoxin n=1 Tax=Thiohalophilus sp. TaxID=3028392 RepID=UPI00287028BA|nr:thioredoxin [Thiohalophilus sp.]MDR9435851.1 thioredoxin [Thiohalophilus sp.]